jgi:hypothetical protein
MTFVCYFWVVMLGYFFLHGAPYKRRCCDYFSRHLLYWKHHDICLLFV